MCTQAHVHGIQVDKKCEMRKNCCVERVLRLVDEQRPSYEYAKRAK